ncbi:DJ-1 family glyoxalase III [Microbulbifer rhizosphaerae]|uniref:4-methyl-5(B-hydroxyethyl)-thiazole monophosphate biosynthesis n=1 Tax=Microbulbifer rhizosphaerae TaxID=1562603 RepID=A0A7W4WAC4_9GAMM|nr:DJ-1 family glyoxalase III [Microbulbifer rhizosphaerae]MBB3060602.1 4-methyl-5(b-hydroxyethyl)-thiazole monophosphate biosynthesis [Microbulbifer rhizosphaerae]
MAKVLVPIAEGSEEIEAVTIIDVLRRAGAEVTVASVMPEKHIRASRGVHIEADRLFRDLPEADWDLIALPGGAPGAEHFHDCEALILLVEEQLNSGRLLGAICASPAVALGRHGLLKNYRATCHSGFRDELQKQAKSVSDEPVVCDRNLITSQAPGTAMAFALQLVSSLFGEEKAREVAEPMAVSL